MPREYLFSSANFYGFIKCLAFCHVLYWQIKSVKKTIIVLKVLRLFRSSKQNHIANRKTIQQKQLQSFWQHVKRTIHIHDNKLSAILSDFHHLSFEMERSFALGLT